MKGGAALERTCGQKENTVRKTDRVWQGRRDSNTQPTVLETATLPLSHSPITFQQHIELYNIRTF